MERLTKEMERQTEQAALYEAQTSAQTDEKQAAKEALSEVTVVPKHLIYFEFTIKITNYSHTVKYMNELRNWFCVLSHFSVCLQAEMEMASLLMARKQLLQQWNSSLVGMRRRGEAFTAMQDATRCGCLVFKQTSVFVLHLSRLLFLYSCRMLEHQLLAQDREIKVCKKTITEEQEQNEILTMRLNRARMDNATSKSLINQKQAQQEAMQAHYITNLRTLHETERTLAQLTKVPTVCTVEPGCSDKPPKCNFSVYFLGKWKPRD